MKDYTLTFWETVKMRLYKKLGWAYRNKRLGFGFTKRSKPGYIMCPYIPVITVQALSESDIPPRMNVKRKFNVSEIGMFPFTQHGIKESKE